MDAHILVNCKFEKNQILKLHDVHDQSAKNFKYWIKRINN